MATDDAIQLYANIDLHCAEDDDPASVWPKIDAVRPADARHTTKLSRSLSDTTCSTKSLSVIVSKRSRSLPSCLNFAEKTPSDCKAPLISTAEPTEKTIGDLLGDDEQFQHRYQQYSSQFKRDDRHRRRPVSKLRSYARPLHAGGRYDRQARRFHPSHPPQPCFAEMAPRPSPTYPYYYYSHVPSYCSCSSFTYDPSYCPISTQYAYPETRYNQMPYVTAEPSPCGFV